MSRDKPRLLIVDNEAAILRSLARSLRDLFEPATARNVSEARDVLERGGVDLVLSDVRFPAGDDGLRLFRDVRERWPRLRELFFFMSGGVADPEQRAGLEATGCRVFSKPFDVDELRDELLTAARSAGR